MAGRGLRAGLLAGAGLLGLGILRLNACAGPLAVEPLRRGFGEPVVDEHLELARAHAPWILHAVHPTRGRQDLPAPVDFDGDLDGENAWETFPAYELPPTVYYAVVSTPTHRFLTYHLYHPRDWTRLDVGLHLTHENDGENLQVVVERASGEVVLVFTQAHYRGRVRAREGRGFAPRAAPIDGPPLLVDGEGRAAPDGAHAVVFVESGGHGILGLPDPRLPAAFGADGRLAYAGSGLVLRPARPGEAVREPRLPDALEAGTPVPYRLESTVARLWPLLRDGTLVGEGRLLDGAVPYDDGRVAVGVPRYYEADRFSGPFGPDRGISPFAVDVGFRSPHLGALLFDPARRWAELLVVPEPWSREYEGFPFD